MLSPSLRPPAAASLVSVGTSSPEVPWPSVPGPPPTLQGGLPLATGTLRRGSQTQVFRPSEGPSQNLPPGVKKVIFFAPCGAKLWGSGGAPPTNLILLRNQRKTPRARRRHVRRSARSPAHPTRDPPGPTQAPPIALVGWGVGGWRLGWVVVLDRELRLKSARWPPISMVPRTGTLTSVFAGYDCSAIKIASPNAGVARHS